MSSSPTSPQWKHDVFVSFRNDRLIKTFITDLFKRLDQLGINYFKDDNKAGAGQENEAERPNAICQQTFAFAVVLFSKNYVDSSQCLKQLVEILNCKRDPELVVIPIFCLDRAKVLEAASDGAFKKALGKVKEQEKWRSALANGLANELANGSNEWNLIDKIVGRLVNEIHSRYSGKDFTFGPFGSKGQDDWKSVDIRGIDRKEINVEYGYSIKSITFKDPEGTRTKPQYGKKGEDDTYKVKLQDGEYITSFAGSRDANKGKINSLTFRTNKRILGPIGREEEEKKDKKDKKKEEEYFSVPSDAGEVIKFFWRKEGHFLESVGARVLLADKKFYPFQSVVGLFGKPSCGKEMEPNWDDKPTHANVRKIIVYLDQKQEVQCIRSIEFTYEEENGRLGEPKRHGSNTGGDVNTITIDCPDEYLTSISGYYTDAGITSLTFLTNKQMTRPIGEEKGIYFSSPATAGKIVGFYGYIDGHLRGIGAYFEPISDLHPVKSIGPFGGGCHWDDGKFNGVREIHLFVKSGIHYIRGIKFVYDDGSVKGHTATHGNCIKDVSPVKRPVLLDYPREYLTSISGYTQEDGSISSLAFHSNRKIHGLYGKVEGEGVGNGEYFGYPSTGSRIIGFYGTWGKTLNSIGVYAEPIPHLYPFKIVRPPIEGSGGTSWDDGVHTNVRGLRVTAHGPKKSQIIESITFMYDDNGSLVEGSRHGGGDAGKWEMLDFPKERLTMIKGCMLEDSRSGQTIIHSLTIYTTRRFSGPHAERKEPDKAKSNHLAKSTPFVIPEEDGTIVGFFGTAKEHLNSIGARLEPY